jgi:hypothetical protein
MTTSGTLGTLARSLVNGAIVNTLAVAPALAAPSLALPSLRSLPVDLSAMSGRDMLLYGSIALLLVALIAKVIRDRHYTERVPQGPDLRWWKNPPPNPQP